MKSLWLAAAWAMLIVTWCTASKFPPGFKFGAATSAYQIEGAWNVSDKGESMWDRFAHNDPRYMEANGDVASDSYNKWMDDVNIAVDLGLHFYRFSISWPRLLPSGTPERISEDGKRYYNNLINTLIEKGIEPVITLYHWDLPQRFQDLGGWANPYIADWLADFARVAFTLFGDRVNRWITINEPQLICEATYNTGFFAPGIKDPEFGNYLCSKNLLLAHAKAWHVYDREFRSKYEGKVGMTNQLIYYEAKSPEAEELAELTRQYMVGLYSHPIHSKNGGWPPKIERIIAENSKKQGFSRSRLPPFTKKEIKLIKGASDFFGFNYYTARLVRKATDDDVLDNWPFANGAVELGVALEKHPDWDTALPRWLWVYPEGIRKMLGWLKKTYGDFEIFITENGVALLPDVIDDQQRVKYYKSHLEQVWRAIYEDGINVTGYTAWTMIDNFEWADGYEVAFGLYKVDFEDPEHARIPRTSANYFREVIRSHSFDVEGYKSKDEL